MRQRIWVKLATLILIMQGLWSCTKDATAINTLFGTSLSKQTVDAFIDKKMESLDMPGLSIAIINEGRVVYHNVKGYANKEKQQLVDSLSIFEGASISKPVFGHFVMTLVEDGLLDLDRPLYKYLPNHSIAHDERYRKITARMALSHRTGFPNWRDDYPTKELFIQFEPGSEYHYSGEGYQYLAEVVRQILNTNWAGVEAEFQKRIAIPFKMQHTKFIQDAYLRRNKVQPYDQNGRWIDKSANAWWASRDSVFVAPTTLHSEALDFSKWMIAIMDQKGLSSEGYEELFKSHSDISSGLLEQDYTLGFVKLSVLNLADLYTHSGNNDGFSTYFALDKDKKWGFVFFTNASRVGEAFAQQLTYKLLLSGTNNKVIAIVLAFVSGLLLVLINLYLLLFRSRPAASGFRKTNLYIGFLCSSYVLALILLMLSLSYGMVKYLYPLGLFLLLCVLGISFNQMKKYRETQDDKKFNLIIQKALLIGVLISGLIAGFVE